MTEVRWPLNDSMPSSTDLLARDEADGQHGGDGQADGGHERAQAQIDGALHLIVQGGPDGSQGFRRENNNGDQHAADGDRRARGRHAVVDDDGKVMCQQDDRNDHAKQQQAAAHDGGPLAGSGCRRDAAE
ncbi:hypothetical protein G6F59_016161 [Rhizopus arrhizus]|nr:hypothetical protein G6F59_016161 [Rhizopus arrhizus]